MTLPNSLRSQPDASGHFGAFGGRYVAETLMPLILELEKVYKEAKQDPAFDAEFTELLRSYVGRPNPLYHAARLTEALRAEAPPGKGAKIYLKRERSEEHTSELQSLMRISYAVFCLKKKTTTQTPHTKLIKR